MDLENPPMTQKRKRSVVLARPKDEGKHCLTPILVTASVFAVSLDPLFFYVLIIDQQNKCLEMDRQLKIVALVLRSFTDIIFLVHFLCELCILVKFGMKPKPEHHVVSNAVKTTAPSTPKAGGDSVIQKSTARLFIEAVQEIPKDIAQKMSCLSVIVDFLSLLPIPQLVIVLTFYKMKGSGYLEYKKVLNAFLLGQYVPRIYRIHLSSYELQKTTGIWVKGVFNFFLYILASHVLGAFWYFFSIQRETSCWHNACVNQSTDPTECMNTFFCGGQSSASYIRFINEYCPLDTPDGVSPPFNFGIFLDSLQNHNTEHINFGKKFFYSFWWGLRNLSNFGTNLTTTTYVWENLFAILVSICGLLLFLYLIGNLQTFMQMEATKSEETRQKIKMKKLDVQNWIARNKLNEMNKEIMKCVRQKLKHHKDADNDVFSLLPPKTRASVKRCLFLDILKTVPMLEEMNTTVLEMICSFLKPVVYDENSFSFRMGDPLDRMLFIVEGTMWTYSNSTSESQGAANSPSELAAEPIGKGQFYGEELVKWASAKMTKLPTSTKHVKSQTRVEAFALMAKDLETVVSKCQLQWDNTIRNPTQEAKEDMALSTIKEAVRRRVNNRRRVKVVGSNAGLSANSKNCTHEEQKEDGC